MSQLKLINAQQLDLINATAGFIYPSTQGEHPVRTLAHGLKNNDQQAINTTARLLASLVPDNAIIVPMSNACGKATYTLNLAKAIQHYKPSTQLADILTTPPRQSLYTLKKKGEINTANTLHFTVKPNVLDKSRIILLDNVIDTGTTLRAARQALNYNARALALAVSQHNLENTQHRESSNLH